MDGEGMKKATPAGFEPASERNRCLTDHFKQSFLRTCRRSRLATGPYMVQERLIP